MAVPVRLDLLVGQLGRNARGALNEKRPAKAGLRLLTKPSPLAGAFDSMVMLRKPSPHQSALEIVTLEQLVPSDHLLRKIASSIDFSFIRGRVAHLYCADNGRPALDPEVLFKILLIGYLFGIRSERQLMREIAVNVAYRWFLDMRLSDSCRMPRR
jgi:hypothetical protein